MKLFAIMMLCASVLVSCSSQKQYSYKPSKINKASSAYKASAKGKKFKCAVLYYAYD